jgi:hypothetical protein
VGREEFLRMQMSAPGRHQCSSNHRTPCMRALANQLDLTLGTLGQLTGGARDRALELPHAVPANEIFSLLLGRRTLSLSDRSQRDAQIKHPLKMLVAL